MFLCFLAFESTRLPTSRGQTSNPIANPSFSPTFALQSASLSVVLQAITDQGQRSKVHPPTATALLTINSNCRPGEITDTFNLQGAMANTGISGGHGHGHDPVREHESEERTTWKSKGAQAHSSPELGAEERSCHADNCRCRRLQRLAPSRDR